MADTPKDPSGFVPEKILQPFEARVAVTQVDREAACKLHQTFYKSWPNVEGIQYDIRSGKYDDDDIVQLFARHRLSHTSAAEPSEDVKVDANLWLLFDHFPKSWGQSDGTGAVECACGQWFHASDPKAARAEWAVHTRSGIAGYHSAMRKALEAVTRELQVERDHLFSCCTVAGDPETLEEGAKPDIERMDAAINTAIAALKDRSDG